MNWMQFIYLLRSLLTHCITLLILVALSYRIFYPEDFNWTKILMLSFLISIIMHLVQCIVLIKNRYPVGAYFKDYSIWSYVRADPQKNPFQNHDIALQIQKALRANKMTEHENRISFRPAFHLNSLGAEVFVELTDAPGILKISSSQRFNLFEWGQDLKNLRILSEILGREGKLNFDRTFPA
jgi:hypothetical protein